MLHSDRENPLVREHVASPKNSLLAFNKRLSRIIWISGLALGVAGLVSYVSWLAGAGIGAPEMGWDFRAYYAAASVVWRGDNLYELGSATVPFYLYSPTLAALMTPLAALSLAHASEVWLVLQHLFLLSAGFLVVRLAMIAAPSAIAGTLPFLSGLLIFLWGTGLPLRQEIYLGQVNSLVLLLTVAGLYLALTAADSNPLRASVAGLLLALAISIKVFPVLLLLLLLLRGRWRTIAWILALFLVMQIGLGLLTVRADGYSSTLDYWFSLFPDLPGRPGAYTDNQSLNGWLARLLLPATGAPPQGEYALWRLLVFFASAVFGLLAVLVLRFSSSGGRLLARTLAAAKSASANWPLEAALLLTTINIVSSISWTHHMLWWVLPALALVARWLSRGIGSNWIGVVLLALIAAILSVSASAWLEVGNVAPLLPAPLFSGLHLLAIMLLWAMIVWELVKGGGVAALTPSTFPAREGEKYEL